MSKVPDRSQDGDASGVAQASSPAQFAAPAKREYVRDLPHMQPPHRTFFITFNTDKRWHILKAARKLVLDACLVARGTRFELHAAVVMPDHVHVVLSPLTDSLGNQFGLVQIIQAIKGASSHAINHALGRKGVVWQRKWFDHVLRSDESARAKCEYVCANPVRAGLVKDEDDYPWLWREWIEGIP